MQHELKGDVIKVIPHHQHLGRTTPNIFCPRYKIVNLDSKFKRNVMGKIVNMDIMQCDQDKSY
jgi:hypothetical protein